MCLIHSDRTAALRDVAAFIAHALRNDGRAHCFTPDGSSAEIAPELARCGCGPELVAGNLDTGRSSDVYAPDGRFDPSRMLRVLADTYGADRAVRPGPVHYTGEMAWALEPGVTTTEDLISYERSVNDVCALHPFSAVCQYDAARFEPELLSAIMRVHPYMLVDGMVVPSPHFHR
jgi:hypothetical protein